MLTQAVKSYLAMRRAAGFILKTEGNLLLSFGRFSDEHGKNGVCAQTAIEWAALGRFRPTRARRLGVVVGFATYMHAEDPGHEIPPKDIFGSQSKRRPTPYIFSTEQIRRLVEAASHLGRPGSLRGPTYSALFALLSCTGLRVSEAIHLRWGDLTPDSLIIRASKFGKSRLVPLHPTAHAGLERYLARRHLAATCDDHLFISLRKRALLYSDVRTAFRTALQKSGLSRWSGPGAPTLHSLRHTFAVRVLESCPDGKDRITRHTVALSTYLGHSRVSHTYWYLEATPRLMRDIAQACETFIDGERK